MDPRNRRRLQQHQQDIINDLEVADIFDYLYSKNVLSDEDTDKILNTNVRSEKAKYLLDTIIQHGNNKTFEVFVDSLAKGYNWLWEKLAVEANEEMVDNSFEDSLSKGDVPRPPDHHVRRQNIEKIVATKLKQLTRHKFLVLHGMPKSGKTCVAISVLRNNPELITENFNGVVFWLNFGAVKTDDDIIALQSKLLRKATSIYMPNNSYNMMNSSISMSSIGSNADSHSTSNYDCALGNIRDTLKTQFIEPQLKECLLVLDKVNERKCVQAFDIGCKILITTRDTEVVRDYDRQIVEIENSFKEQESLELFASCLDETVTHLPSHAKKLNEICRGSPFLITLIGAQLAENKERLKHDPRQWKYYLNKLEKKDLFDLFSWRTHDNPMKTIEFCINSLDENILPLYKKLAILPDNVKVSAKVLSKLWNRDINLVESIMKKLRSKSLIIEYYDREQRNYIYEVDDLLMNYLKTSKKDYEEESKKLHYDFLQNYQYGNLEKAPIEIEDDGYIAYYIGYHILNTKDYRNIWNLFKKLFMNLKFLGNKVRLTGPDDVILDLQKYESYITSDTLDIELLHSVKAFLRTHGTDLYRYPCTNIVQSILQHESQGILYQKASTIAKEDCAKNELYFEFLHEYDVEEIKHSTIDVKENITAVCFLGDYVLVGTNNGAIKFFHIPTNKLKKELFGSGSPIKWIGVACIKNPPTVAALCFDGVIKLWHIDDIDFDDTTSVIDEEPEEHFNNFSSKLIPTINPKLGPFVNCRWTNNEEYLITQTTKMIMLYHANGEIYSVINNFERDRELLCSVPCYNDRYVAVATCSSGDKNVELINVKTKERLIAFEETDTVMDMLTVPDSNKIITLKEKEILEREFRINTNALNKCNPCRCRTVLLSSELKENLSFLSMAINKTGTLLFVSTDDSRVVVVDLKSYSRVFDLENRRGNVIAMAVSEMLMWDEFEPSSDVLLTGSDKTENSAKVWYLDASYISQKNNKVRLTTKFDVSFRNLSSPITPTSHTPNSGTESTNNTPKRHQSFANHKEITKTMLKNTMSLDRQTIKPLNLKGICNNNENTMQPLLAVVDDKNNIQVMRGRKVLTEILDKSEEQITAVKISPCNHYICYGLRSGIVKKYTLRTKEVMTIVDVYSPVQYLNFVNSNLLMVAGKNRCLMAYNMNNEGEWEPQMLQAGNTHLGSQEILNDLQGVKKKNGQADDISSSGSESSVSSRDRAFPSGENKGLCKPSGLVECFWITGTGLVTVEHNAVIKLWDKNLKLSCILNARRPCVHVTCAAFQKNILVICDSNRFQTFELKTVPLIELQMIQDYKLNNVITSCDLTADGNILALGLDSGNIVIQNVKWKRQICLLKHHKTKVQSCAFSPVSERMYRSSMLFSPMSNPFTPTTESADEDVPLVLVTMAAEFVWWNLSYIMKMRVNNRSMWSRSGLNALTPIASPSDSRSEVYTPSNSPETRNFFFNDDVFNQHCWKAIWKGKTCKEGSKKKEILACIKLSGMNAKRLCHDERFSCFVTVDNPGHVHIMNVMRSDCT